MEQILSQPDPIEIDTTTDGCSTSSYVSTVSSTSFLYLHCTCFILPLAINKTFVA